MQFNLQKVGRVIKPHGFRGQLQVRLFRDLKQNWFKEPVFLEIQEQPVPFFIDSFFEKGNHVIVVKFKDCNSEHQALKLKGLDFMVNENLVVDNPGFSYLVGWKIKDEISNKSGTILNVVKNPHQSLIQAQIQDKEVLIPLVEEFISEINAELKILSVRLPQGLLEIYL